MFRELLPKLKISESDLLPYDGGGLTGFNGSRTVPLGYIELKVTYGGEDQFRTIKTHFLVLPCPSPYHCIIGRPTLGKLGAVISTVHLKMKFFSEQGRVVTIRTDREATKRCHYLCMKEERRAEKEAARKAEEAAIKKGKVRTPSPGGNKNNCKNSSNHFNERKDCRMSLSNISHYHFIFVQMHD